MARSRQDVPSQGNSRNRPSAQKIMGLFFPFLFHNLFPEALFVFNSLRLYVGSAAQLWFSLIFLFPFPHKREGKRLPQKQRVLDSFQLSARGKCPPGKFSDGETLEGERGKGEGGGSPCRLYRERGKGEGGGSPCRLYLSFSLRLSPLPL